MSLNVDLIFKLAAIGILVAVINTVLDRVEKKEYGQLVTLAGVAVAFLFVLQLLSHLFNSVRTLFNL